MSVKSRSRSRSNTATAVTPLVEAAHAGIEGLILSGEIPPGARLNELALAERFGLSRGPIREAIRALEHAKLVTVVPNRGALVRKLDLAEALELYEVRAGLARSAGRLLTIRATAAQLSELDRLHEKMSAAAAAHLAANFHSANLRFHDLIMRFAGNARLQDMDLTVRNELQLYIRHGSMGDAQLRQSNMEHGLFLEAVKRGESEAAGLALERHVLNGKQRMLENAGMRS